ncbi:MAG TPA: helix-turn-helix domain-containing protein [Caldithrix abyssi]|uniref:Helix-turn-helix domain-containing protein n=1 Tax=Caldithrix abyssi TaxID=187145 RepID=A0A7V4WWL8_CALAY|nr:helix-turn-helix domain-containing protein [Caldithrix abyssi]
MNVHTKPQIIKQGGKPLFAVIPWEEYERLINEQNSSAEDIYFPHEVVKYNASGDTLIKAWRKYLGLTQTKLAEMAGMKQSALARIEAGKNRPKSETIKRLARAMDISPAQLID